MRVGRRLAALLLLSTAAAAPATRRADLDALVEQLNAADPAVRDAAERRLADARSSAVPTLLGAVNDPRPEVSGRARRALRRLRLFTLHGPPEADRGDAGVLIDDALRVATEYLSANTAADRAAILVRLSAQRPVPAAVLVRLLLLEPNAGLRRQLLAAAGPAYRSAVAGLVADGDDVGLRVLLDQAATEMPSVGPADFAVHAWLTGRWDEAVEQWRAELSNGPPAAQARAAGVLCALYRVADRPADAADAARRSGSAGLQLLTALDRSDWQAAAAAAPAVYPAARPWPLLAVLARLRGDEAEVAAAVTNHAASADAKGISTGKLRLLLDADPAAALAKLSAAPDDGGDPPAAVRLLAARGEYDAALALASRYADDADVGRAVIARRDEVRRLLGELPAEPREPAEPDPAWTRAVTDAVAGRFDAVAAGLLPLDRQADRIDAHYLRGYALDATGDHDRGRAVMRDAAVVPLADAGRRGAFAAGLAAAGLDAVAAEQRQLARRSADLVGDSTAVIGLVEIARAEQLAAARRRDWPAAAAAADRVWLFTAWPGIRWNDPALYLSASFARHFAAAQVARGRDDWPAVNAELATARRQFPGTIEVALLGVPMLDAHGDHAAADALFAAGYGPVDAAARRWPNSPFLHNQAAWLAACGSRKLDEAVAHAEAAVRLTHGTEGGYLDTLAECHFRRGDRAAALDAEHRAAARPDVDAGYLARQLARFATAPVPTSTRPVDAPD